MAEFLNRDLRVNSTIDALTTLRANQAQRVAAIPVSRGFTTTPDGRVLDSVGRVVYTPTPIKKKGT